MTAHGKPLLTPAQLDFTDRLDQVEHVASGGLPRSIVVYQRTVDSLRRWVLDTNAHVISIDDFPERRAGAGRASA